MIVLDGVGKTYHDGTVAVADLSFEVATGELVCLVGPSGCGKTTTMKMINRLVEPTQGRILLGGQDVRTLDPVRLRRRIGYVIQQVGLFPHLTVRANVGCVPRLLRWSRRRARERADELLELVGLDPAVVGDRYPHELSGGQQQRVGVARALAADPPVLLMDEPFSALDPITRERLQDEFARLRREIAKTIVFVTHDIDEAVRLADRVAVFRATEAGGRLEQIDTPARVLAAPATPFVAEFTGATRSLRRLDVAVLAAADLEPPAVGEVAPADPGGNGRGPIRVGAPLSEALAALLARDDARLPVYDGAAITDAGPRLAGYLTPTSLHAALRRAAGPDA
ncbi:MAG: ATP-binding cassette domain-containing protein [Frankia sp.]|nr:ATP-binding cassette domain-containing protein [Frankia sp.]